ncbi:hypothetical protein [Abyssicoccus albus]|uniref:hypothetical protein n=1 Tax=Abyssicoccus albus TaxID=1817405 RepID=UPI0011CD98B9|nr:hypothetical protein [Abyssicoccus albus]
MVKTAFTYAEMTLIVVLLLAMKVSSINGELVSSWFLIDNFITVFLIFCILRIYGELKERYIKED